MVILKKIKGSTLMETLVATVLIVVVFMISSLILNNLFGNSIKNNQRAIKTHLNELEYLYLNEKLALPFNDDFKDWKISIISIKENNKTIVLLNALNQITNQNLAKEFNED